MKKNMISGIEYLDGGEMSTQEPSWAMRRVGVFFFLPQSARNHLGYGIQGVEEKYRSAFAGGA